MNIWRINLKPAATDLNPRDFCLTRGLLGVGYAIEGLESGASWEDYTAKAETKHGSKWRSAVRAIRSTMDMDDLVWTRDREGVYWLGRVTGEWEYQSGSDNRRADIVNVRPCEWVEIGLVDSVPGKIVNSFRGRALQRVLGQTIRAFTQFVYNEKTDTDFYSIEEVDAEVYSLLQPDDLEDLIGLYLQHQGYRVIPSSAKRNTARYEYVLRHKSDGRKAVVQVKTSQTLAASAYADLKADQVYLFSAKGGYTGSETSRVAFIDPDEVKAFMRSNHQLLPDKIRTWLEVKERISS